MHSFAFALIYSFSTCFAALPDLLTISNSSANTYTVSWFAKSNCRYQLQSSGDGINWTDLEVQSPGPVLTCRSWMDLFSRRQALSPQNRSNSTRIYKQFDSQERRLVRPSRANWVHNQFFRTVTKLLVMRITTAILPLTIHWSLTPLTLSKVSGIPIIAPFWADVDTRNTDTDLVTYGSGIVDGRNAFGANYFNVGYYEWNADKLNSFQVILIDRSDTGSGNFDVEFNYSMLLWETGDVSGGTNGFGGNACRAGISNGSNRTLEIANSGETLKFLDSSATGLVYRSRNSTIPGRFIFQFRSGALLGALQVNAGIDQSITQSLTTLSDPARILLEERSR